MRITVKLFAILRDRAGHSELEIAVNPGADAKAAVAQVAQSCPAIADMLARTAIAVNREYVSPNHPLKDGDELALIPPVSGG